MEASAKNVKYSAGRMPKDFEDVIVDTETETTYTINEVLVMILNDLDKIKKSVVTN